MTLFFLALAVIVLVGLLFFGATKFRDGSVFGKAALISSACVLIGAWLSRIGAYFEAFFLFSNGSMVSAWIFFAAIVFAIVFLATYFATIVVALLKKAPARSLVLPLLLFLLSFIAPFLPVPSVTDGLRAAIGHRFSREKMMEFATLVRSETDIDHRGSRRVFLFDPSLNDDELRIFENLREEFPKIMSLNALRPRFSVTGDAVTAYYGGALSRHWGYAIVANDQKDACPKENLTASQCQKVFDNVWVYTDNY